MTDQPRPQRLWQRRVKGTNIHRDGLALNGLPTVSVVRGTYWGNPYDWKVLGKPEAVRLFCEGVTKRHAAIRSDLRGKNLACYCPLGDPCHADHLLAVANAEDL